MSDRWRPRARKPARPVGFEVVSSLKHLGIKLTWAGRGFPQRPQLLASTGMDFVVLQF